MHSRSRMPSPSGGGARSLSAVGRALVRSVRLHRERAMSAVLRVGVSKAAFAQTLFVSSGIQAAFTPIPLLPRVLKKIRNNRAQVILVAPDWAQIVWYPELLSIAIGSPLRLPLRADLLSQ
ncbi:hypothetical protein NDU88_005623 [Pleurodeles waltl]|uniref:Uncharacterized protein n=1 Tax=Pleurodeles waltl TaxID=8319 RepID=A0AAV7L1D7_PLEWA|nr:hypothetical protein NDU88_005623 [Pleurodeles waltl]